MAGYIQFAPGAVAAGTTISLPPGTPPVRSILRAEDLDVGNYLATAAVAPVVLTVVTVAPEAGQVQLFTPTSI